MKALSILVLSLISTSVFALPVASHEAIQGVQATAAFKQAQAKALSQLRYYTTLTVASVGREDAEMMRRCFPTGAISKSASQVKVTFANPTSSLSYYFATDYKPEDFGACN